MKVYKFSTPSCTYCKIVAPKVYEYAKKHGLEVIEVNADSDTNTKEEAELTAKYEVMSVPVVVFEDQGQAQQKLTGFGEIMQFINQ